MRSRARPERRCPAPRRAGRGSGEARGRGPAGYHVDPAQALPFVSLASQKQYVALYHLGLYDPALLRWFRAAWPEHTAAKLDFGKSCLRLRDLDQVPYQLLAELAGTVTPVAWIARYQRSRRR